MLVPFTKAEPITIDLVDIHSVPQALPAPAGFVSIVDMGADPTGMHELVVAISESGCCVSRVPYRYRQSVCDFLVVCCLILPFVRCNSDMQ